MYSNGLTYNRTNGLTNQANRLIPAAKTSSYKYTEGNTGDIMNVVKKCYRLRNWQVKDFAPVLHGRNVYETCSNIWHFVKENIAYKVDPEGVQWIKAPATVWQDKFCDCKSYSVFVASLLHHNGIEGFFRFVSFAADGIPTHVYVVVPTTTGEIKLDCVMPFFNQEKPFTKKYDYSMTKIAMIGSIGEALTNDQKWERVQQIFRHMQDEASKNSGIIPIQQYRAYEKTMNAVYEQPTAIGDLPQTTNGLALMQPDGSLKAIASNWFAAAKSDSNLKTQLGGFLGSSDVTLVRAAGGDPSAVLSIVTDKNTRTDILNKLKNGNSITLAKSLLAALFSSSGVSASIFVAFPFLMIFDNSTGKWKSNLAKVQDLTPDARAAFYIDLFNDKHDRQDLIQYHEMFGYINHDKIDDRGKVSYKLCKTMNDLVDQFANQGGPAVNYWWWNNDNGDGGGYGYTEMHHDLTKCYDYQQVMQQEQFTNLLLKATDRAAANPDLPTNDTPDPTTSSKTTTALLIGGAIVAAKLLF